MNRSIVEYCAEHEHYRCGYCGRPDTNYSHGLWAHSLTVADYQGLVDRGWRRSGKYCYKPTMDVTCCPMYTIRCRALEFKLTKSQKKVLKRVNKYMSSDDPSKPQDGRKMSVSSDHSEDTREGFTEGVELFEEATTVPKDLNIDDIMLSDTKVVENNEDIEDAIKEELKMDSTSNENGANSEIKDSGPDPNRAPCKKAKQLRLERKLSKMKEKGIDITTLSNNKKNNEKQLEDFINELPQEFKDNLEIRLVRTGPPSAQYLAAAGECAALYARYQRRVHGDSAAKCTPDKYTEFLVDSPLKEEYGAGSPACGYGSFQQHYRVRGRLVAVAALDLLPRCVSSVYYYYDPDYAHLNLGTYGALREIEFTRKLHASSPSLQYYYMGYYIHSCPKMRYKGNFAPSDLLCPETYQWSPIEQCIPKLEATPYSRLNPDLDALDQNLPTEKDMSYIPCWVKGTIMPYKTYKRRANVKSDEDLKQYSQLVGASTVKNMLLVRA